jgi:hypothetical protein
MRLVELSLCAVLQFTAGAYFGARALCKRRCAETPQTVNRLRIACHGTHRMRSWHSVCESNAPIVVGPSVSGMHAMRASDSPRRAFRMTFAHGRGDWPALSVEAIRSCSGRESHCWLQR